jgi:serine/threonine protein kinase
MLVPNTILQNRYLIVRLLAQGGMGAVYEATDQNLGCTVAVKETFFTDENLRRAFEREARLLANLRHAALPKVMHHFSEGNGQFLVMEFIPGEDLMQMLERRGGPFPVEDVLDWADQILSALVYLHRQQPPVIHRDIKPHNLKLAEEDQIVLLDFGLAKGSAWQMSHLTTGSSIRGYTPDYAPLEQMKGTGTDARSDLYSLGATLYHLITGERPVDALTRVEILADRGPDPLRRANKVNARVTPDVASVLEQAMQLNRDRRFSGAIAMRKALGEARGSLASIKSNTAATIAPQSVESFTEKQISQERQTVQAADLIKPVEPRIEQQTSREAETSLSQEPLTKKRKSYATLLITTLISLLLIGAAGYFYYYYYVKPKAEQQNTEPQPSDQSPQPETPPSSPPN